MDQQFVNQQLVRQSGPVGGAASSASSNSNEDFLKFVKQLDSLQATIQRKEPEKFAMYYRLLKQIFAQHNEHQKDELLKHILAPDIFRTAQIPSMFPQKTHPSGYHMQYTLSIDPANKTGNVVLVFLPQQAYHGVLYEIQDVTGAAWKPILSPSFNNKVFHKMRMTGAAICGTYFGTSEQLKGMITTGTLYNHLDNNVLMNTSYKNTMPSADSIIDMPWAYQGPVADGFRHVFMPHNDQEYLKWRDADFQEDMEQLNTTQHRFFLSEDDHAIYVRFDGLPKQDGGVIKIDMYIGIEGIPAPDHTELLTPKACAAADARTLLTQVGSAAHENKTLVSSGNIRNKAHFGGALGAFVNNYVEPVGQAIANSIRMITQVADNPATSAFSSYIPGFQAIMNGVKGIGGFFDKLF